MPQTINESGATVLITTHYIDEARESGRVSFLRDGHLLAEESPELLLKKLQCKTLEEVFFTLSRIKIGEETWQLLQNEKTKTLTNDAIDNSIDSKAALIQNHNDSKCSKEFLNYDHLYALFCRDYFYFTHNLHLFMLYMSIPIITLTLFSIVLNNGIRSIPIAIYNGDQSIYDLNLGQNHRLSDLFINEFNTSMVALNFYQNEYEAERSVKLGHNSMVISFRSNFSHLFLNRYFEQQYDDHDNDDDINGDGEMHIYYDYTNLPSIMSVNNSILVSMRRMIQKYCEIRGLNPQAFAIPIEEREYLYGTIDENFLNFIFPMALIYSQYLVNVARSAFELLYLNDNGCMNRDLIQGVRPVELILELILASMISLLVQTCLIMIFTFGVLGFLNAGDYFSPFMIIFTTSVQGMATGILLAIVISDKATVMVNNNH